MPLARCLPSSTRATLHWAVWTAEHKPRLTRPSQNHRHVADSQRIADAGRYSRGGLRRTALDAMRRDRVEIVSGSEISPGRPARASDAHEKVAKAVVEPFDVRQHAHGAHG